jgi:anti-anti-sigma factor
MEIKTSTQDKTTVIQIVGSLDGATVTEAQDKIMPLVIDKCCLVLDLGECSYISSAGLRLLLMIAKQLSSLKGCWGLAGLSDEVKDVMEMTGFSNFFKTYDTVPTAIAALKKE